MVALSVCGNNPSSIQDLDSNEEVRPGICAMDAVPARATATLSD